MNQHQKYLMEASKILLDEAVNEFGEEKSSILRFLSNFGKAVELAEKYRSGRL